MSTLLPQEINALLQESGLSSDELTLPSMMDVDMGDTIPLEQSEEINVDPETGEVVIDVSSTAMIVMPFGGNLAEHMDEEALEDLGADLVALVDADLESRKPWMDRFKKGLENLGIYNVEDEEAGDAAKGINRITHPLLLEAAVQFQARAMAEIYPSTGPVDTQVLGDVTPEKTEQAGRIKDHMNWQLTVEDRTYIDECDQKLFYLPFTGSEFDKQYNDPMTGRNVSRWVKSTDLVMPYDATSIEAAERITHIIPITKNKLRKLVAAGFYLDLNKPKATENEDERQGVIEQVRKMDGLVEGNSVTVSDDDDGGKSMVFYEVHVEMDMPGFNDEVPLPYIVTIDRNSKKTVGVRRNWRETDENREKRIWFTHKKFLPGFGVYGYGLLHCIGGLSDAATKILNILLDAGAYASLQGGFKSKDAKIKGDVEITPGEWVDTEMTAEELAKAFYTPPFKEPSPTLMNLLNAIQTLAQRFAATTEVMVGDAATTGPVGTTVAQIEQASKVFSGIHKRLHKAVGDELIHLAELNGEHLPDMYPFDMPGGSRTVLRADYDGRIDVIPVSDPNIFSSAQRIAMAQATYQMAVGMPDVANKRKAALRLLSAMRVPNPDEVVPTPAEATYNDPVTEGALVLVGRPIRAFPSQNHQAHITVHQMQLQMLHQVNPQAAASMQAHTQEHIAQQTLIEAQMQGLMVPPVNWGAEQHEVMAQALPPEIENQIAIQAAQVAQKVIQQQQQQADESGAAAAQATLQVGMADVQRKAQKDQMDLALKQQKVEFDKQIKEMGLQLKQLQIQMEDQRKRDEAVASLHVDREAGMTHEAAAAQTAKEVAAVKAATEADNPPKGE